MDTDMRIRIASQLCRLRLWLLTTLMQLRRDTTCLPLLALLLVRSTLHRTIWALHRQGCTTACRLSAAIRTGTRL